MTRFFPLTLVVAFALTGCGTTPTMTAQTRNLAGASALAADKGDRPAPPSAKDAGKVKQGLAARQAARSADRALYRYADLLRQWERARTDEEKDRLEQDMLYEFHSTLDDVRQNTSASGHDYADREAYDRADRALTRYDRLFREWERARTDAEKRRIVNEMLTDMMEALQAIKRIV